MKSTRSHSMSNRPVFFKSLELFRALAAVLVIYDHLVGEWLTRNNISWMPERLLSTYFFEPLGIMMHGGAFAVALFFMVSGFVIPYVAKNESRFEFCIKRFFRIYPPFWVSIFFLIATNYLFSSKTFSLFELLSAATFMNYFISTPAINGVAWTLVIEVMFYIWIVIFIGSIFKNPYEFLSFSLLTFFSIIYFISGHAFSTCVVYGCFMFLGVLFFLRWSGLINQFFFYLYSALFWLLFLWGIDAFVAPPPYSPQGYAISYGLAFLFFIGLFLLEKKIKANIIISFLSKISYSIYLFHGFLGWLIIKKLYLFTGYSIALAVSLAIVLITSYLSYVFFESTAQSFGRRIIALNRLRSNPEPARQEAAGSPPIASPAPRE